MGDLRRRSSSSASVIAEQKHPEDDAAGLKEQQQSAQDHRDKISSPGDEKWVWRVCLAFRLLNSLLVRTYFNPDEHWQALEVAHRMVFGYGYLTWEWERGIRSYVHPLIFAALYKLLALTGMDTPWFMVLSEWGLVFIPCCLQKDFFCHLHLLINASHLLVLCPGCVPENVAPSEARAPRLLQALFAAVADLYLFKLSFQVFGRQAAYWTVFSQIVNWFTFFCMVRTLSNSLETMLTIVALFYWPNGKESRAQVKGCSPSHRQLALTVAAMSCAIRPTNGIIWLYLGVLQLFQTRGKFRFLLAEVFPIGVVCLSLASLVDRWMYGYWTIVPINFLKFNFLSSGGDFYGTHPWHWYFSQGFPVMLFSFLPISVAGMWWAKDWLYAGLIGWVLSIYSILGHKEFRFVLPVLPLSMMFAGYGLTVLEQGSRSKEDNARQAKESTDLPSSMTMKAPNKHGENIRQNRSSRFWWIILGLLSTNVPTALYTSMIHQRGGEAVMEYLAEEAYHSRVESVLFLMPCHSTPFYSSLHQDVPMRFLDCSPSDKAGYVDEADRFKAKPMEFLHSMFPHGDKGVAALLPSHVVLYDSLQPQVQLFLANHHYKLERRFFHAHFPVDRELQGYVLVFSL